MVHFQKVTLILLLLSLFSGLAYADSFVSHSFNLYPNLDTALVVTGVYDGNTIADANQPCDTFIFDENQTRLVARFDTTFTNNLGRFSHEYDLTYPTFQTDTNYYLISECAYAEQTGQFRVIQRLSVEQNLFQWYEWVFLPENIIPLFIVIFVSLFFGYILIAYYRGLKLRRGY